MRSEINNRAKISNPVFWLSRKLAWPALCMILLGITAQDGRGTEIVGPQTVGPQQTVKLSLKDEPAKSGCAWEVVPLDNQDYSKIEFISTKKGKSLHFIGPLGRYQVNAFVLTIDKDGNPDPELLRTTVTFGMPDPKPPVPPKPPEPPAPDDPVLKALSLAYKAEGALDKVESRKNFADMYRQASDIALKDSVKSYKDIDSAMRVIAFQLRINGKLLVLQRAIRAEILKMGLKDDLTIPLTQDEKAKCVNTFNRISAALLAIPD